MTDFNKKPSIAIQWAKGIGKDFFANAYKEILWTEYGIDTSRYAFADVLKIMSYTKSDIWDSKNSIDYDFDYLKKDYFKCRTDEMLVDFMYSFMDNEKKSKFLWIFKKKYEDLNDEEKLFLIEIFKNIPELSTRAHLQTFSDYVKESTGDTFFFSDALMQKIKTETGSFEWVINTDPRYLVEIVNLLSNDFFLIKLVNGDINEKFDWIEHREHVSESELSLNKDHLGLVLDVTWSGEKVEGKIRRQTREELVTMIETELIPALKWFKGYSKEFKDQIERIKTILKDDKEILELQNEYSKLYKTRLDIIKEGLADPTPVEWKLKAAYQKYSEYRDQFLSTIKDLLDEELSGMKNVKNDQIKVKSWLKLH